MLPGTAFVLRRGLPQTQQTAQPGVPGNSGLDQILPDKLLLKDFRPKSIYRIPVTKIPKAKYPVIDMHYHAGARTPEQLDEVVKVMDRAGVERTIAFAGTGERFDQAYKIYSRYPDRFDIWCGFDLSGHDQPGFGPAAVKELERCHTMGARGVGEIVDKGRGFGTFVGTEPASWRQAETGGASSGRATAPGPHADDPRMDPLFDKCAQLGMPVNIHVSDPIWGYQPQNRFNDGLMNGFRWRLDDKPGLMGHDELVNSLEHAAKRHPKTVFIACHFANLDYDLGRLGQMLERNPNLYVDISARFNETAPIPRFAAQFYKKYADRVCYGTDMGYSEQMFSMTFRILESTDEHFYESYSYHWPQHGFGLPDDVLKKVYRENALLAYRQAKNNGRL